MTGERSHWGNQNTNPAGGSPVATLPAVVWIGNAATVLGGGHGDVTGKEVTHAVRKAVAG